MGVSRSGYYQYSGIDHTLKIDKDFELLSEVRQIHKETRGTYGSRRTSERLRAQGHDVGRYRARSLMKKAGVSVKLENPLQGSTLFRWKPAPQSGGWQHPDPVQGSRFL